MLRIMTLAAAAVVALTGAASAQNYPWKPEKPITLIVPWAAGGSTDQVSRVAAAEIEKALGQKVVVVNQGGASGSIGTRNVLQAPADGYTWAAGAAKDLGTYAVSGMLDTKIADWRLYLHVINVSVLSVTNNTPYKTPQEVVDAMKAKPGQVSVGSAGVNSSGHTAIEAFTKALGVTYKHVSYDGGNPAVISTVVGRDRSHHAARGRAGADDPRQAAASARGAVRPRARTRRLRHDPADHLDDQGLQARRQLFRHLRAARTSRRPCCRRST